MYIENEKAMFDFAKNLSSHLCGGEVIVLVGDLGAGKTTFTRGVADGMGIQTAIQSPTYTISREYNVYDGLRLAHYDFYRLDDPGIMAEHLSEYAGNEDTVTVVEWADVVKDVLPEDKIIIQIQSLPDDPNARNLKIDIPDRFSYVLDGEEEIL